MNHMQRTAAGYNVEAPKRRINVTVNEDLVRVAQEITGNLSGTVEALLAAYVAGEIKKKADDKEHWKKVVASWNEFDAKHGSFAEEWAKDFLPEDGDR